MFAALLEAIDGALATREWAVLAVSGFGGAGKSTLADRLRDHYALRETQVLRLDSFIVDMGRGEGMLGGFDWERFQAVLEDVREGRRICYQPNDFEGNPRGAPIDEEPASLVIVEGVRLLRPELAPFFDLSVWIDCDLESAAAQGKRRDRDAGVGAEDLPIWEQEWNPKEAAYFERHRPDLTADLLYTSHQPVGPRKLPFGPAPAG